MKKYDFKCKGKGKLSRYIFKSVAKQAKAACLHCLTVCKVANRRRERKGESFTSFFALLLTFLFPFTLRIRKKSLLHFSDQIGAFCQFQADWLINLAFLEMRLKCTDLPNTGDLIDKSTIGKKKIISNHEVDALQ